MPESLLEKFKNTEEEERFVEYDRVFDMVENSKWKNIDAERHSKRTKNELYSSFDEKEFTEMEDRLYKIFSWNYEETLKEKQDAERKKDLATIIEKKDIFVKAYDHTFEYKQKVLSDIVSLIDGGFTGEVDDEDRKTMKKFGLDLVAELTPKIMKDLQEGVIDPLFIEIMNILIDNSDNEKQKNMGIEMIGKAYDIIVKGLLDVHKSWISFPLLKLIRDKGNTRLAGNAPKNVAMFLEVIGTNVKDYPEVYARLVSFLLEDKTNHVREEGLSGIMLVLALYDLPLECLRIWSQGGPIGEVAEKNISKIIELENKQPGICHILCKDFGIADFGRYPSDLLFKQYEEKDNLENPYGIVIFPRYDYDGTFYYSHQALQDCFQKVKGEFSLRVVECGNKRDIARALITLDKKYNPSDKKGHKISLAIIGGHGSEDHIEFGKDEKDDLYLKDLVGKGVQRTSNFFEENPTVILISCSTGREQGMGPQLSEVMGARVIAPKANVNIRTITAMKQNDGKFIFNAEYEDVKK